MLMNNLDPDNAERPEDLVVYGGTGKAARSWEAYDALVRTLRDLEDDETLLVQSGKPVGVMRTHAWAPRVLIANSNLVGDWANWEEFRRLEDLGLTMYGQMTAGSWIYIGTQGILQGTFETFAAIADKKFGGTLAGTITVTAGLGGMGGAQPLAVTMNDGVAICIECDQHRIDRRLETRYLDVQARDLDHAIELALEARDERRGLSIGLLGNAAELLPELLERHLDRAEAGDGPLIDIVTDQTSAHDPLFYLPAGTAYDDWERERTEDPRGFTKRAPGVDGHATCGRWSSSRTPAPRSSTTATRSATRPARAATTAPSSSPASCRPTSARCSARARARSAGPRCRATPRTSTPPTAPSRSCSRPTRSRSTPACTRGSTWPRERVAVPGPAGAHLLAGLRRPRQGRARSSTRWSPAASSRRRS